MCVPRGRATVAIVLIKLSLRVEEKPIGGYIAQVPCTLQTFEG